MMIYLILTQWVNVKLKKSWGDNDSVDMKTFQHDYLATTSTSSPRWLGWPRMSCWRWPSVCPPAPTTSTTWSARNPSLRGLVSCRWHIIMLIDILVCSGFMFVLVNSEVTEEREELLYDELSLVAELGGALGLFLGFSFLTVWDLAEAVLGVINKYMK